MNIIDRIYQRRHLLKNKLLCYITQIVAAGWYHDPKEHPDYRPLGYKAFTKLVASVGGYVEIKVYFPPIEQATAYVFDGKVYYQGQVQELTNAFEQAPDAEYIVFADKETYDKHPSRKTRNVVLAEGYQNIYELIEKWKP